METKISEFGICRYDDESFIIANGIINKDATNTDLFFINENKLPNNTTFVYNTRTNEIKYLGQLNGPRRRHVLVNCLGTIYALGGIIKESVRKTRSIKQIEKLNPTTNKWEILQSKLNIGSNRLCAISHNEFIYLFGDKYSKCGNEILVEKFNTLTGEVKTIESKMINARSSFAICKVNSNVYLISENFREIRISRKNMKTMYKYKERDGIIVFNLESETFTETLNLRFKNSDFIYLYMFI